MVIADGGFQANLDMVRAFGISPAPEKLLPRNGGTAVGDGIKLAQSLGGAISMGMNNIYGHIHSRDAMKTDRLWPRPYLDEVAASGIVVDASGRRVADEGLGGIWLSNAIARTSDPLSTTIIVDQPIWDGPGRNHVQPPNPLIEEAGGTVHRADTLGELAALAGIPAKALEETVAGYNAALDAGTLPSLSPPRTTRNKPWPIRTPPYYCGADLHRHHQLHGRHRGGRRRPRARQKRQADPGPLCGGLHGRRTRWRPARRLRRRSGQGHHRVARCRSDREIANLARRTPRRNKPPPALL